MIHVKGRFKVKGGSTKMLTIGRVAQQVGVRPSAIRYYEGQKILEPAVRGANGYRFYTDNAVKLLRFVRRAQALGITLKEIKPLLDLATRGEQPCKHVQKVARTHLRDINNKIRELEALRKKLRTLLRRKGRRSLGNAVCPIIECRMTAV
jgi:MerR family transcriptional regulator, copper efflux regulator